MKTKMLNDVTFMEVYHFLESDQESEIFRCFKSLFGVTLLLFPAFMCRDVAIITDLATGATLAGGGLCTLVNDAAKKVFGLLHKKRSINYGARYEQMQIAQVMLVYAAYFDTISHCLPNENDEIILTSQKKYQLSRQAIEAYLKKLNENAESDTMPQCLEKTLIFPEPAKSFSQYLVWLREFYEELNDEFKKFFEQCRFYEELDKDVDETNRELNQEQKRFFTEELKRLPKKAIQTYERQYYQLESSFPEFAIWANHHEHIQLGAQIDIGFKKASEEMKQLFTMLRDENATDILVEYKKKYMDYIKSPIIDYPISEAAEDITFPAKKEIFIPQAFQLISYQKGMQLEPKDTWKDALDGKDIGQYISSILRHPQCGEQPLLILGIPGAGKTLLCHMLAAQILSVEYYVIIIHLRDTIAEDSIMKQVDAQIERDLGGGCRWNDLVKADLDKGLLLIFDGYDELLQASGKTYSNYLTKIEQFQKDQSTIHDKLVRCIVTSRVTLIDKAVIPSKSQVFRLLEFDDQRIQIWSDVWNKANKLYFDLHMRDEFNVTSNDRVRELAGQPLLLLMLAVYEIHGGSLNEQRDVSRSELYYKLIWDFISREKRKEAKFCQFPKEAQEKEIRKEFCRLGIAALGMYNRKKLFIRSEELNKDIGFLMEEQLTEKALNGYLLEEGDKLFGRFFFIHSSRAVILAEKNTYQVMAYEFLHNTFGEFLTAYYIMDIIFQLVRYQQEKRFDSESLYKNWKVALSYVPLFTRPVILSMLYELFDVFYFKEFCSEVEIQSILNVLFQNEITQILTGHIFADLEQVLNREGNPYNHSELMIHVASYSVNLIVLRAVLSKEGFLLTGVLNTFEDWKKLTHIWRYAFSEGDLVNLSSILRFNSIDDHTQVIYNYTEKAAEQVGELSRISKLYHISNVLGDDVTLAVFGILDSQINPQMSSILKREGIALQTAYALSETMACLRNLDGYNRKKIVLCMQRLWKYSELEKDILGVCVFSTLLHVLSEKRVLNQDDILDFLQKDIFIKMGDIICFTRPDNMQILLDINFRDILLCLKFLPRDHIYRILCGFADCFISKRSQVLSNLYSRTHFMSNSFFAFCEMLDPILKIDSKRIPERILEFLFKVMHNNRKSTCYKQMVCTVFRLCYFMEGKEDEFFCEELLKWFLKNVSEGMIPEDIISQIETDTVVLEVIVDFYYDKIFKGKGTFGSIRNDRGYLVRLIYNSKTMEKLSYSSEESFYRLVCLLCVDMLSTEQIHKDCQQELYLIIDRNGERLSMRTLKKIQEYGYLQKNVRIVRGIERLLNYS